MRFKKYITEWVSLTTVALYLSIGFLFSTKAVAQDTAHVSMQEAVEKGLTNSKPLRLSSTKIDEALAQIKQADDAFLPDISVGFSPSEAFILTRRLHIKGLMEDTIYTPKRSTLYMWSLAVNQPIYTGNKLKYARESAELLRKIASTNSRSDSQEVKLNLIKSYINIFLIGENQKIADQELKDVQERLKETTQFMNNGLATENDVLRFRLQEANVRLKQIDLANNRAVANYTLSILMGTPEEDYIEVDSVGSLNHPRFTLNELINTSLSNRKEITTLDYQNELAGIHVKQIKSDRLPTLGAGFTTSWVNPNAAIIPPKYSSLGAFILGLNLNWNISSLYKSKHRMEDAAIQQRQTEIAKDDLEDHIKMGVQASYHAYLQSLERIKVLETAVEQARENDRIMELKYQNQLAPTTDRIDAQTLLYQSLVNLSIAHANAASAYYELQRNTGTLMNENNY